MLDRAMHPESIAASEAAAPELRMTLRGTDCASFAFDGAVHEVRRARGGPTYAAARLAIELGADPRSTVSLWRGGRCVGRVLRTLGEHARRDLVEPDTTGLRVVREWRPFPGRPDAEAGES